MKPFDKLRNGVRSTTNGNTALDADGEQRGHLERLEHISPCIVDIASFLLFLVGSLLFTIGIVIKCNYLMKDFISSEDSLLNELSTALLISSGIIMVGLIVRRCCNDWSGFLCLVFIYTILIIGVFLFHGYYLFLFNTQTPPSIEDRLGHKFSQISEEIKSNHTGKAEESCKAMQVATRLFNCCGLEKGGYFNDTQIESESLNITANNNRNGTECCAAKDKNRKCSVHVISDFFQRINTIINVASVFLLGFELVTIIALLFFLFCTAKRTNGYDHI